MRGERGFAPASPEISLEQTKRRAMCDSLVHSAKRVASLGSFLASANGIAGCVSVSRPYNPTAEIFDAHSRHEHGVVADDLPIAYEQMVTELKEALEPKRWPMRSISGRLEPEPAEGASAYIANQLYRRNAVLNQESKDGKYGMLDVKGFEEIDVSAELVREYLQSFPRGWVSRANVESIVVQPRRMISPNRHAKEIFAFTSLRDAPARVELVSLDVVHPDDMVSDRAVFDFFDHVLPHELGHLQSFSSSPSLEPRHVYEMMYRVWKATTAEHRPKLDVFTYPHTYQGEDVFRQMREYEPTLYAAALRHSDINVHSWDEWESSFGSWLRVEAGADEQQARWNTKLVRRFFSMTAPEFQIWSAAETRHLAASTIALERRYRRSLRTVESCEDPKLKAILFMALQDPSPVMKEQRQFFEAWQRLGFVGIGKEGNKVFQSFFPKVQRIRQRFDRVGGGAGDFAYMLGEHVVNTAVAIRIMHVLQKKERRLRVFLSREDIRVLMKEMQTLSINDRESVMSALKEYASLFTAPRIELSAKR